MTALLALAVLLAETIRCIRRRIVSASRLAVLLLMLSVCMVASDALAPAIQGTSDYVGSEILRLASGGRGAGRAGPAGSGREAPEKAEAGRSGARVDALELSPRYALNVPHVPEAHLVFGPSAPAVSLQRIYLRTFAFDTFQSNRWRNCHSAGRIVLDDEDGAADGRVELEPAGGDTLEYRVCLLSWHSRMLPHIPTLTSVELPAVVRYGNDLVASPTAFRLPYLAYSAISRPARWNPETDTGRALASPGAGYLALPEGGAIAPLCELALGVAGEDIRQPGQAARQILTFLQANYRYAQEVKNPNGRDPLENFLFDEKAGHCELFATSFALMLRAVGIPSRVAIGYCGGEYDARTRVLTFFRDDAHAWTEIYLRDGGWVIADATPPGARFSPRPPRPAAMPAELDLNRFSELSVLLRGAAKAAGGRGDGAGGGNSPWAGFMLSPWVGLALLGLALAVLVATRLRAGRALQRKSRTAAEEVLSFLRMFLRHFARQGHPLPKGSTLREYVLSLKERGLASDEFDEMVEYVYAISYRGMARSWKHEKQLTRWLRAVLGR
jgi:transglutaminase-like putative cysteine protease